VHVGLEEGKNACGKDAHALLRAIDLRSLKSFLSSPRLLLCPGSVLIGSSPIQFSHWAATIRKPLTIFSATFSEA